MYKMLQLICDRPRFIRITVYVTPHLAEKQFCCPVKDCAVGGICRITEEPCEVYVAQPFDNFASIAKKTGREGQKLQAFNGGAVYPTRRIFLYPLPEG